MSCEWLFQPVIDELSRDGEFLGQLRQMVSTEPSALYEFLSLQVWLSAGIVGMEGNHQPAGVWPGLRAEVSQVADAQSGLFGHFSVNGLFKRLSCLYETCYEAVEVALEVASTGHEHLVGPTVYEYDDGCGQLWPHLFAALLAAFGYGGVQAHLPSADATEAGGVVPIDQLGTLTCLQIVLLGEVVVRLAQWNHYVARAVGHRMVDGIGYHGCAVGHGRHSELFCPLLKFHGRCVLAWHCERAVLLLFEQQ